jgi:hypothetical protein
VWNEEGRVYVPERVSRFRSKLSIASQLHFLKYLRSTGGYILSLEIKKKEKDRPHGFNVFEIKLK